MGPYEWITKEALVYRHPSVLYLNPNSAVFDDVTRTVTPGSIYTQRSSRRIASFNAVAHDIRFLTIKFDCVFGIGHLRHGLVAHCAPPWV